MADANKIRRNEISWKWFGKKKKYCENCGKPDTTTKEYDKDGYLIRRRLDNKNPLTIHHIDGNIYNNEDNNLQTLCRKCHDLVHNQAKK